MYRDAFKDATNTLHPMQRRSIIVERLVAGA